MNHEVNFISRFTTDRLIVAPLKDDVGYEKLANRVVSILSPEVTKALPPGWQSVDTNEKAVEWIKERASESVFLTVKSKLEKVIGFIFLYPEINDGIELRFGYLLSKESWGKGIGTEVLTGFIEWSRGEETIKSVSGGVEKSNIGSIKVLEKVGFTRLEEETEDTVFYEYQFK